MQQRNYSPNTINTYLGCISSLSKHYNKSPDLLTTAQINHYLHYCITEKDMSHSMVNQTISAYKVLLENVLKRKWMPLEFPRPKKEKHLPEVLSKQEVALIFKRTANLKHRTLLMLAYSAGLRISEVLNLKPVDIDSSRMQIRIRQSKGHKDRTVILSEQILAQLRIYWKKYKPLHYLFEGQIPGQRYSQRSVQHILKKSVAMASIKRIVTFHTLRHSFATHMVEDGVDVIVIQRLLGHNSLKTTSVYLHLRTYDINKVKSPFDTLKLD